MDRTHIVETQDFASQRNRLYALHLQRRDKSRLYKGNLESFITPCNSIGLY
jgi:hypothetical protein